MRNVVLVTVDSLRADHCGPYDPPADADWTGSLTPTLDALADEGVVFERAVAPGPRTPSSMPAAFTGEPVASRGVYDSWSEKTRRWRKRRDRIRRHLRRHRTVAERFADAGHATGAVTANPWTTSGTGFESGFDEFVAVGDTVDLSPSGVVERALDIVADIDRNGWLLTWPDLYGEVSRVIEALPEPYFLWVFLLDPHQPYLAPRRFREENTALEMYYGNFRYNRFHGYLDDLPPHLHSRLHRAYRDAIRSTDGFLDRLLGDLGRRGDDPVVCVHADHGEAFGEHGFYSHRLHLYEENVHVPLVISGVDGSGRVEAPTSLCSLPDLLLDAADGSVSPGEYGREYVHASTEEDERVAVRGRDWKYVRGGEAWSYVRVGSDRELYDLQADPGEGHNRAADRPAVAADLDRLCDRRESDLAERRRIADAAEEVGGR